jgi:hypothetical protein
MTRLRERLIFDSPHDSQPEEPKRDHGQLHVGDGDLPTVAFEEALDAGIAR